MLHHQLLLTFLLLLLFCVCATATLCCSPPPAAKDAKGKAASAAKAVKKNTRKKSLKPRYSVVFHRPKTLKRTRTPKYTRTRCVCMFCVLVCMCVGWGVYSCRGQEMGRWESSGRGRGAGVCV